MENVTPPGPLTLTNARVVLPTHVLERASIVINNGLITSVEEQATSHGDLDLDGVTVFPGFIDVHIHGALGVDTMNASSDDLRRAATFLATRGVTSWLPTFVPATDENYQASVSAIEQLIVEQHQSGPTKSARTLGVHYEGPFVSSLQCGALHVEHFKQFTSEQVLDQLPVVKSSEARMMMTFAPEVEGGVEHARSLVARGWIGSIGHTRADIETLDRALAAGVKHMTHFMNAMLPLHHRNPGPIAWGMMHDDVSCDIIADGHHLAPYMLSLLQKVKGSTNLCLISDAIAAAGMGDGDYEIWGETINVTSGRTSNAKGSIAGSVITMLDAVRMMRERGATDVEVAAMAALNPARLLRLDQELGSIEVGKRADLVGLDEEGMVRLTVISGEIAFRA